MPPLEVEHVSVRFGASVVLDDVSLTVPAAGVTGLIGPNGAGKTTLFNVICGFQAPMRGRVRIGGVDVTRASTHKRARRGMARTFQRIELFASLTVRENLLVAAEGRGHPHSRSPEATVEDVAARIGVSHLLEQRADVVTTGQARLVELARALVTEPTLLLLDEPASGLDSEETDAFATLLGSLAERGMAVLLVEHDVPLVMRACAQISVLDHGRIIAEGTPTEVRADPRVVEAYLGAPVVEGEHG